MGKDNRLDSSGAFDCQPFRSRSEEVPLVGRETRFAGRQITTIRLKRLKTYLPILLLYLFLSLFFLRGIIFSKGAILGGDWGFPQTLSQMRRSLESGFYTWAEWDLFGIYQPFMNGIPLCLIWGFFAWIGISGEVYVKFLLVLIFTFSGMTMFILAKFCGCRRPAAILGGWLYMTTPFFFNYTAIGWIMVLFSMGLLPLAVLTFIKSVRLERIAYSVLTGLMFSLAVVQSQSLVWYPLVFFSLIIFLARDKKSFFRYLKSLMVVFLVFLGTNAFWELPLFWGSHGSESLNTQLGLSVVSLGTWARLTVFNILRTWGSLFNHQYESSYSSTLVPLTFILPLLAYLSLVFLSKKRLVYSLVFLSFVPVILFKIGPYSLARLPFSDLIRDVARFSVISSFAYIVLATIVLDFMLRSKQKLRKVLGTVFSLLLIVAAYPFWAGELSGEQKYVYDTRLKSYQFPEENIFLEEMLAKEKGDFKVLYLPVGNVLSLTDDRRFSGMFREIRDIFATYSPKPGVVGISDRDMGSVADLVFKIKEMQDNQQFVNFTKLLDQIGVKYVVVRKNVDYPSGVSGEKIASLLEKAGLRLKIDGEIITLLENENFLPSFFLPKRLVYATGGVESLLTVMNFADYQRETGIYLKDSIVSENSVVPSAGEIFIETELISRITANDLNKVEKKESIPTEEILKDPNSFVYPFFLKKEAFEKWSLRNDLKRLFEKHLLFAHKRIREMVTFNADRLEDYQEEIEAALAILKGFKDQDQPYFSSSFLKVRGVLWAHHEQSEYVLLDDAGKKNLRDFLATIDRELNQLIPVRDFSQLVYNFKIPKKGQYSLLVNNLDRKRGWENLGEKEFERGTHQLILPGSHLSENLIDENLKIRNYSPDTIYKISFDYKNASDDDYFFIAEGGGGEIAKTFFPLTWDEFGHFEMFFRSSLEAEKAIIHHTISQEKNLKVQELHQPELVLRSAGCSASYSQQPLPQISFVKINPTKYKIKVEEAKEPYVLIFSESFHRKWKVWLENENIQSIFAAWSQKPILEEKHFLVNGYANSWYITPGDVGGKQNYNLIIEFWPQRLFYVGLGVSLATFFVCVGYLIYSFRRRN